MKTIADWKPGSERRVRSRVTLGRGDAVDPGRYLEIVNARWEFCNILTREAPECVEDLYRLLPLTEKIIQPNRSLEDVAEFRDSLVEWCERWHVPECLWMFSAGFNSLIAYALVSKNTDLPLRQRLITYPLTDPAYSAELSRLLEELNPGWQDDAFAVVIPAQVLGWQPTREPFDEVRNRAIAFVDEALMEARGRIEAALRENGALAPNAPILEDWFVWAVHRVILNESYNSMAKRFGKVRSAIRTGTEAVLDLVGLPRP